MTFPAYLTPGAIDAPTPNYKELRLVSIVGGSRSDHIRTMKTAAARRATPEFPVSSMRVYTEDAEPWEFSGFTDIKPLRTLTSDIGELPPVVFIDAINPFHETEADLIEHVKASVRRAHFLMVSYSAPHLVVHNADLVWFLDAPKVQATG